MAMLLIIPYIVPRMGTPVVIDCSVNLETQNGVVINPHGSHVGILAIFQTTQLNVEYNNPTFYLLQTSSFLNANIYHMNALIIISDILNMCI